MLCKTLIIIRLLLFLCCFHTVKGAAPSFTVPTSSTPHGSVYENSPKDVSILTVEGTDTDGDTLKFSLVTQNPSSPPFSLDSNSGLLKTPTGLDAEFTLAYTFTFGVSDGTATVNSVPFILNLTDINEFSPVFHGTPYNATILDSTRNGTFVIYANATDADATATVTYTLQSGNSPVPFSLNSSTGKITVSDSSQLNATSTPSYSLGIQASDGTNTANQTVLINVKKDFCYPEDPCQHGTCVTLETNYSCNCTTGFLGKNCSQVDYCYPADPCQHGTCVTLDTKYFCNCTAGFLGKNCSQVDYCNPINPCQNGTCVTKETDYLCNCSVGYMGRNCSQEDYCYPEDPCQNGTCVTLETEYFCNCTTGFFGQNCSQVDYCNSSPCHEGSTCTLSNTNYTCTCAGGYIGRKCDQVDYCYSSPCHEGSTCTLSNTNYTCTCAGGYIGRNCDQVNYCYSSPCHEESTCSLSNTNYTCHCAGGYIGRKCDQDDPCYNNPCVNGGTCTTNVTSYTCNCTIGYTGTNCTSTITSTGTSVTSTDYCASNPCKNGATCTNGVNQKYKCTCYKAYTGLKCEKHQSGSQASGKEEITTDDGNDDTGLIVGLIIGGLFVVCVLCGVLAYKYRTKIDSFFRGTKEPKTGENHKNNQIADCSLPPIKQSYRTAEARPPTDTRYTKTKGNNNVGPDDTASQDRLPSIFIKPSYN